VCVWPTVQPDVADWLGRIACNCGHTYNLQKPNDLLLPEFEKFESEGSKHLIAVAGLTQSHCRRTRCKVTLAHTLTCLLALTCSSSGLLLGRYGTCAGLHYIT